MYITIQYFRALAAIMVVLTHISFKLEVHSSNFLNLFSIGGYGVDLFLSYLALLCAILWKIKK